MNQRGYSAGGVALAFKKSQISLKKIDLPGNEYEIVFSIGSMPRFNRKLIAVCVYMPPSMSVSVASACLSYLVDSILELKQRYKDPFIVISGDFNSHDICGALSDYPDLFLLKTGPTWKDKTLDLIFTNFPRQITESGTLDPLESDSGSPSDHNVVYCTAHLKRYEAFEWLKYTYMGQTEEGSLLFKEMMIEQQWDEVYFAGSSSDKASAYQDIIDATMATCFPLVTVKRKSSEDPWITEKIRKKIRKRKAIFKTEGCLLYTSPSPRDS